MNSLVVDNIDEKMSKILDELARSSNRINIAVAYLTDITLIKKWIMYRKKVNLIISLTIPTDAFLIKELYSLSNYSSFIEIKILRSAFHSKFCLFYRNNHIINAIVGSSNFTSQGLNTNIETNVYLDDKEYIRNLETHYRKLWGMAYELEPIDVINYTKIYQKYLTKKPPITITHPPLKRRLCKKAKNYLTFWKITNEIKDLVESFSKKQWPNIPVYISMFNFWDWVKNHWDKKNIWRMKRDTKYRKKQIKKMYVEFINEGFHTKFVNKSYKDSKRLSKLLNPTNVMKLSKRDAKKIFIYTYSGELPRKICHADELFIHENDINDVRKSLKYLLWSNDQVVDRINNLLKNKRYKLHQFGSSLIQELLGRVRMGEFPLRNDKADDAVILLGFKLK